MVHGCMSFLCCCLMSIPPGMIATEALVYWVLSLVPVVLGFIVCMSYCVIITVLPRPPCLIVLVWWRLDVTHVAASYVCMGQLYPMPVTNGDLVFPCYSASSFACFRTVMEIFAWHYQGRCLQVLVMCLRLMSNEPISDLGELVHGWGHCLSCGHCGVVG